jgi:hypothetical protein
MDAITTHFSTSLRRLSTSDPLVSAGGGISAFVQAVLVPELAVRMVMDDMSVDEEGARGILIESAEIGSLLCEEEDEWVDPGEEADHENDYGQ